MSQALPLSLGLSWFRESCRAVRMQPLSYPAIVIFSLLVSGMLTGIPFIGTLLASLWMPYASVLTGFAARDTLAGRVPVYTTLIAIFRDKTSRYPLLILGLISSVWMEVDMLIFSTLGADALDNWKITAEGIDLASITSNFPYTAFAVMFILYLPLLMMTLFSPLLIVQNRQKVGKSLFYSFFGVLRAIGPVLVWVLIAGAAAFALFMGLEVVFGLLGVPQLFAFLAPLVAALFTSIGQAGIWVMFRDIFAGSLPDGSMPEDLESKDDGSMTRLP